MFELGDAAPELLIPARVRGAGDGEELRGEVRNLREPDRVPGREAVPDPQALVALRIIQPLETDPEYGPPLGMEQTPVLEILHAMSVLNFRLEEMRDMVRVMDTLGHLPASENSGRYRIRLGMFAEALQRRPVVTREQHASKQVLIRALTNRYTWLTA